jgi:hypothetical protein
MATTSTYASESQPQADANIAAARAKVAEQRAAAATAAADQARAAAKAARAAASKAHAEADDLRKASDPEARIREKITPDQAKMALLDAARSFDPFGGIREHTHKHPFTLVGIAAGTGAVLGASGGVIGQAIGGLSRIGVSLLALAKPMAMVAAQFAAGKVAANSVKEDVQEAAAEPSNV